MMQNSLADAPKIDAIMVFDLDFTIWPFWLDTHIHPNFYCLPPASNSRFPRVLGIEPFLDTEGRSLLDNFGQRLHLYKDVRRILTELHAMPNVIVAACSHTSDPPRAKFLLDNFGIAALFDELVFDGLSKAEAAERLMNKYKPAKGKRAVALFDDQYGNVEAALDSGIRGVEVNSAYGVRYGIVIDVLTEILKSD